ncbi:DJ-1/PfpI family protein [Shimwellia pseudoproteus]|uniref:DJ-1/PfpI family protein n=1 Tax=Shimwellia pseudoproteus TaxID=570012 RepID=UPI0018EB5D15|nr:DJ-1/PfpI family protein [Shimwellia pseudoproteus]MBJ3815982.1 DJ-1/PfpI family protein [Shimwellia pseudoproteus]
MKTAAVLLAPGFEEGEAIVVIDILRRLDIQVQTVACADNRTVVSYHGIPLVADMLLSECGATLFDALILPGGPEGSLNLAQHAGVIGMIGRHDNAGRYICPLCSAAARVLGGNRLLKGRRYVCSRALWQQVSDGVYVDADVVEDGNLISGRGLGKVFDFALTVAARLRGDEAPVRDHAQHIYYPWPG